jgi:hypothetical protein
MASNDRAKQDRPDDPRKEVERALQQHEKGTNHGEGDKSASPKNDAAGQMVRTKHGASNNGMSSVEPRVISGDEDGDATWPLKQDTKTS